MYSSGIIWIGVSHSVKKMMLKFRYFEGRSSVKPGGCMDTVRNTVEGLILEAMFPKIDRGRLCMVRNSLKLQP